MFGTVVFIVVLVISVIIVMLVILVVLVIIVILVILVVLVIIVFIFANNSCIFVGEYTEQILGFELVHMHQSLSLN